MTVEWVDDAACARSDLPPSAWDVESSYELHLAAAGVCAGCPVAAECLNFGVETLAYGVYAGLLLFNGRPRRITRPDAAPRVCGTESGRRRHTRLRETPCDACRVAHAAEVRARRASRRKEPMREDTAA